MTNQSGCTGLHPWTPTSAERVVGQVAAGDASFVMFEIWKSIVYIVSQYILYRSLVYCYKPKNTTDDFI